MNRILIAEDEPRFAAFLEKGLRANGFTDKLGSKEAHRLQAWEELRHGYFSARHLVQVLAAA